MNKKKYILKPGRHQFAPKSPPIHENRTMTDEEAEWYLEKYPHIKPLFVDNPEVGKITSPEAIASVQSEPAKSENNEDLFTTN